MKKINLLCLLGLFSLMAFAEVPVGYYESAEGKQGDELRLALQDVIDNHTVVSYDNLKPLYIYSDTKNTESDAGTSLIDIYSTCGFVPGSGYCASSACGGGYNREHSVPKSWFNEATPMYSDAFHLYPTSCYVNSYRGNYAFGETSTGTKCTTKGMTEALGKRGASTFTGFSGTVYEPDDEYKGDMARTYFYMATRYADKCYTWTGGMFGSTYNGLTTYGRDLLLKWHRQDPVSAKEILRNEVIYGNSTYNKGNYKQNNRNPFIDYPVLAEYIWGTKTGESWYGSSTPVEQVAFARLQVYPNPANEVVSITVDGVDQFTYTIFDISGQMLQSGMAQSDDLVSISQLNGGVYVLQIDANGKNQVVKLVVTK